MSRRPRGRVHVARMARRFAGLARPLGHQNTVGGGIDFPEPTRISLPGRGELDVVVVPGPAEETPILLLHGVSWTAALNYHHLIQDLARERTVVAMDHRGHGGGLRPTQPLTMTDLAGDAVAVLDAVGVERAIVLGFSLGTMTALHIGVNHPDRVAGLILTAGCLSFATNPRERAILAIGGPLLQAASRVRVLPDIGARYFGASRSLPSVRREWAAIRTELSRNRVRNILPAIRAASVHDVRPHVDALRMIPSSVIVTRHDILVPPGRQRRMGKLLGSTVIEINTDHEAPVSHPEVYRRAVLAALASLPARETDTATEPVR